MTDFEEQIRQNLENDWGKFSQFSDFKPGDTLRYTADGSTWTGRVIWVTGPGESHVEGRDPLPLRYIVEREGWHDSIPDVVYSSDILTGEPQEPTLVPCPYCRGHHYEGQVCPLNPNR